MTSDKIKTHPIEKFKRICLFLFLMLLFLSPSGLLFAATRVTISGPGGSAQKSLDDAGGSFDLNLPLNKNAVNRFTVTAQDDDGNTASREISITQLDLGKIVVSKVTSQRLSVEEVEELVSQGVIDLADPENYNVSVFVIVLTIEGQPVPVRVPIVLPKQESGGWERIPFPKGGDSTAGKPKTPPNQEIIILEEMVQGEEMDEPLGIPGVIIIEGRIKSLKEFFSVRLLLLNTSGIFTLSNVSANIRFPDGGLSSVLPADGIASFGDILPGTGDTPGQVEKEFIIRGDEIGVKGVDVSFGGTVTGPGITKPIPFNGSASTDVEVKGPPTFTVRLNHPDSVVAFTPYELRVDITNTGDIPAMYASLELDVGADARILKCTINPQGDPECWPIEASDIRNLGHILPKQTVSEVFTIEPLASGRISSCMGMSDQNITLQVSVGNIGCVVGKFPPDRSSADGPTVSVLPFANANGISPSSPVVAMFSDKMNTATITTGEKGTFNVFDETDTLIPGQIRFATLNEKTFAVWQVNDNITNRLAPDMEYTVVLTRDIKSEKSVALYNDWESTFTTTATGINDTTPPQISLSVEPPVNPNNILPGEMVKIAAYASDQGSGVVRVEARLKDMDVADSKYSLVDQKSVYDGDQPPYFFTLDSTTLVPGHTYRVLASAYDFMANKQDATLSLIIASSSASPTITLPADPSNPVLQGISVSITPEQITGGVNEVRYYLDTSVTPFKTVNLAPFTAYLKTLPLTLGQHTIRAVAKDGLDRTGEDTLTFELVENPNMPVISFPGSVDGAPYIKGTVFSVKGRADDPLGIASMEFYLDVVTPVSIADGDTVSTGSKAFTVNTTNLEAGTHRIYMVATNPLGVTNDLNNPDSWLEFIVAETPAGNPPLAPTLSTIVFNGSTEVTVTGSAPSGSRVNITNTTNGISTSVYGDTTGHFTGVVPGKPGDEISVVVYDFTQSLTPSPQTTGTVAPIPFLVSIAANPSTLSFTLAGQSQNITITGTYSDASTRSITGQCSFTSSNPSAVAVNASGRIAAIGNGTAVITATSGGFTAQVQVTVAIVTLTHITVDPETLTLNTVGGTRQLTATGHYSDGSSAVLSSGVVFTSSNTSIASVNSSGLVTAGGNGGTTIGVYVSGVDPVSAVVTVDLGADPAPEVEILSPSNGASVERGESITVNVKATDAIGGVTDIYLEVSGETTFSDSRQISPASLNVTRSFTFSVSNTAVVGNSLTLTVRAKDNSGKISTDRIITLSVVDETAPSVTITAPARDTEYNFGDTVTLTVNSTDASGVTQIRYATTGALTVSGEAAVNPAATTNQTNFEFTIPYGLTSPGITLHAYAKDSQDNEGTALPVDIIVTDADITPPETHVTAVANPGTGTTTLVTYTVTSGLEDLDHVLLYFRKNGIGTFNRYTDADDGNATGEFTPQSGATGTISFNSTKMGGDGNYEFYTVGVDINGNRESAPDDGGGNVVADESVVFNAGTLWTTLTSSISITDGDTTYDNLNLRITGAGVVVTLSGNHSFHNLEILNGAMVTHPETSMSEEYSLDINVWTLVMDALSSINVNARGYLGGLHDSNDATGQTLGNVDGSPTYAGGSYGGMAGYVSGAVPNNTYGNIIAPMESGSGGGMGSYGRTGGDGGGRIRIHSINMVFDGFVSANGGNGAGYGAGSGSGGGIYITTSTLSGSGLITVNGGAGEVGAGGGRIAVHHIDMANLNSENIRSLGGQGTSSRGGNGTVFIKGVSETNGTLVMDGQGAVSAFSPLPIPAGYVFDNIIIRNQARVIADDPIVVSDTLSVLTGSIITHTAGSHDGLSILAARVHIDETSSIDVSGKGYAGGQTSGNSGTSGLTLGAQTGSAQYIGGSYGGYGGTGSTPPPSYGNLYNPVSLGSGGGSGSYDRSGGNGGGLVLIQATEELKVEGGILAKGLPGAGYSAGGGSGGSVNLETKLLHGEGTISSNGGGGEVGGGGGRIAVIYQYTGITGDNLNDFRNISSFGGKGTSLKASAGTILLRKPVQTFGDLYIDDNVEGSTASNYTPLVHMGFGTITDLTEDTLTTDDTVALIPDGLTGLVINPNINQDQTFIITANTANTITVDISSGTRLTDKASPGDTYCGVYTFDNIFFRRGGFMVMGDKVVVNDTLQINENGRLTHYDATLSFISRMDLTVQTLDVAQTGGIVADGRGYLGGSRGGNDLIGQTLNNQDGSTFHAGASYGGIGGRTGAGIPNPVYGSLTTPEDLGSGGGAGDYGRTGGDGGGRIRILAENIFLEGLISANGADAQDYEAGSGSGGSVRIETGLLEGAGIISANGGIREVGGGGGRIAVTYQTMTLDPDLIQIKGGQGTSSKGGNGTLVLKSATQTYGDLIINGQNQATPDNLNPIPDGYEFDNILIKNRAWVTADHPIHVADTLELQNNSILTHTRGSEEGVVINAANVTIDETSSIDVSAKGFAGGSRDGNVTLNGITLGGIAGATFRSAGSYGGYGAASNGITNPAYGQPDNPIYLGSGGSAGDYSRKGGNGGGVVRIYATGSVTVDGTIRSNGQNGEGYSSGGGSGGSVKITTHTFGGTGTLTASGGAGEYGGGGGRIAVSYGEKDGPGNDFDDFKSIMSLGGRGSSAPGSAGTLWFKQEGQSFGDLYIDDNMEGATSSVYTPLTHLGFGESVDLTEDTLITDGTVVLLPNGLKGMTINPNIDQDETFIVIANTEDTIIVDISGGTSLTEVAAPGDTYAGVYRFDNVMFRRGGFLVTGDRIRVEDTMSINDYGRLTHYDATMSLEPRLDLDVGTLNIANTGSIDVSERGYLGGSRGGNDTTGQTLDNQDGSTSFSGGSYGGLGGFIGTGTPNPIYGSQENPVDLGSGGGAGSYGRTGGDGGGRVNILAENIYLDGVISANGANAQDYNAGSGSGGSVLIHTGLLDGIGSISADGGARQVGGGGGRIAVYYNTLSLLQANITSSGGAGTSVSGSGCPIYLEEQ